MLPELHGTLSEENGNLVILINLLASLLPVVSYELIKLPELVLKVVEVVLELVVHDGGLHKERGG